MIKAEMLFGMTVFEKTVNVGTTDEKKAFVYQIVANGANPVSGDSFDQLEQAIEEGVKSFGALLSTPGVVDPRLKTKPVCCNCDRDDDDD